jgi:peptidyl-prolyl cis-trans isomerase C
MVSVAGDVGVARDVGESVQSAGRGRWLGRWFAWMVREPFFQFVALGALLFAASEYLEARANFARIDISRAQIEGITNNYRLQYGASPTAEQLNGLVDQFIKEEVFYHEALRLKLDRDDEIIRRRLVQKYEFLQQDLGTPKDPSEADLRAFYQSHTKNYEIPERLTFSHVFFSIDRDGDKAAKARAERVLAALNQRRVTRAPESGDGFPGAFDYAGATPTQVRRAFGSSTLSEEIFTIVPGHWAGPFRSGFGWHLVYVAVHQPAGVAAYDDAQDAVRRDYLDAERGIRNAAALENLKKHFTIVRE